MAKVFRPTSQEAFESMLSELPPLRAKIYAMLVERGEMGATDEEMQLGIPMNPSTQRPRRGELADAGFVIESDKVRKTKSGRNAIVWVAVTDFVPVSGQRTLF
jgi:hypothetical protein